jgi:peroxiredoxin
VALSVDNEEDARKMVERHKIGFPIVYGLDVRKEAERIGAYFDSEHGYFQPANFILRNGKVVQATYSSGPLGRLQAEQVLMLVDHYRKQEKG